MTNVTPQDIINILPDFTLEDNPYNSKNYTKFDEEFVQVFIDDAEIYVLTSLNNQDDQISDSWRSKQIDLCIKYLAAGELFNSTLGDSKIGNKTNFLTRGDKLIRKGESLLLRLVQRVYMTNYPKEL